MSNKPPRKVNRKQMRFCENLFDGDSKCEAYRKAYTTDTKKGFKYEYYIKARRVLEDPVVQEYTEQIYNEEVKASKQMRIRTNRMLSNALARKYEQFVKHKWTPEEWLKVYDKIEDRCNLLEKIEDEKRDNEGESQDSARAFIDGIRRLKKAGRI